MLQGISPQALCARLEGDEFQSATRHGKYLFVGLKAGPWLMLHFGMTGSLSYVEDRDRIPAHTRLRIDFAGGGHLACRWRRRLGRIGLVDDPASFVRAEGLGPDVYTPGIAPAKFAEMVHARRGAIKPALMDQKFLAGIGNIYSDEILFQARLHPRCACQGLDAPQLAALHRALRKVLATAIERGADAERLPRSWLLPNRGKGGTCPRCNAALMQLTVAGRTAYCCSHCQRECP